MIARLSAAALLSVVLAGCGGTEVKGMVREEGSGQPLPGAIVRVGDQTTRTGPGGFYSLEVDIDEDEPAQVMAGAPGYEPKSLLVTIDDDQETVYSDIELTKEKTLEEQRRELEAELEVHRLRQQRQDLERREQQQGARRQQQQQDDQLRRDLEEAQQQLEPADQPVDQVEEQLQPPEEGGAPEGQLDQDE